MKFEKAGSPECSDSILGDAASAPSLTERVQAAAAQLSEGSLRDLAQLSPADTDAGTGEFVFRFYAGSPIPLDKDDDDDDWKVPDALPMSVDVVLHRTVSEPRVEVAPGGTAGAPPNDDTAAPRMTPSAFDGSNTNSSQQVPGGFKPGSRVEVASSKSSESSRHERFQEKTSHGGAKPARVRSLGQTTVRRPLGRASQIADAEPQPEVPAVRDGQLPEIARDGDQGPHHHGGNRGEAADNGRSDDEKVRAPVVTPRAPMPSFAPPSLPSKHDVPEQRPQSRMVRHQVRNSSQAAEETAPSESANRSETYEITYRFTSWGASASVKLNLDGSQLGRPILATPSDSRVHKALRAGMDKKSADAARKSSALPIMLASPSAPVVSPNEEERERHGKPQVPVEEGEQ
ncbi:hypothetical protein [Pandoraea pulmonicola]|uniref:Surface presentation of antigen domain-containing protein n=1 Tax=Pandoraea pulmonicola TaxID=93221 RepID=A0AAJ4ZB17_PANPU|nr:hypothetical protein [Pandoraea pulmonicola]AJC21244.1 hypothetical protein RO07_13490 [Pandoraea pulmonicola]SUA90062.1 Uncharacterised protein [Pandoraea pulmonicola]